MKLAINIHHARSWALLKGFQGQRSKVKPILIIVACEYLYSYNSYWYSLEGAISCVNAITAEAYISTVWGRRGSEQGYYRKTLTNLVWLCLSNHIFR